MNEENNEHEGSENKEVHEHYRFLVDPNQTSIRIDKYLFDKLEKISRNRIQSAVKNGYVLVNDKEIKSNYKIRPRDVIVINLPEEPRERTQITGEDIPLDIRYEDDDIMIVHKPAGLVVHPGVGNWSGTLVNGLIHYMENKDDLPVMEGNTPDRPGLVHRIDKNTSGLLVIAKNEHAMTHLSKQFHDHTIDRTYYAIIWGQPDEDTGTIDEYIGRHPRDRVKMSVFRDRDEGRHAVTHYEVVEPMYYVSLIKCKLETGRTHQIRVHMAHLNHPIFNDSMYGGDSVRKGTVFSKYKVFVENTFTLLPRQALHAKSLGFIHPTSGERMEFDSELPDDMVAALDKWRHYVTHQKSRTL